MRDERLRLMDGVDGWCGGDVVLVMVMVKGVGECWGKRRNAPPDMGMVLEGIVV
jgi:hypothetical protein